MSENEIHQAAMCAAHGYVNSMLREAKTFGELPAKEFGLRCAEAYCAARKRLEDGEDAAPK